MKSFVSHQPVNHQGLTNTWLTPLSLVRSLGEFDLDPCAYPGHQTARRLICLPEDGLKADWHGRVWLNPPYGKHVGDWMKKLARHGNGVALIFVRSDTRWFQETILSATRVRFIAGRVQFLRPDFSAKTNGGVPSCLIAFGEQDLSGVKGFDLISPDENLL